MTGAIRFGLDVPLPLVSKRLALYGNDVNLDELLRESVKTVADAER